jgi:hypothetical protein
LPKELQKNLANSKLAVGFLYRRMYQWQFTLNTHTQREGERERRNIFLSVSDCLCWIFLFLEWHGLCCLVVGLIFMSLFDLTIHSPHGQTNIEQTWIDLQTKHLKVPHEPGTAPYATWQHLTTGYNAGYYSYLWCEVEMCKHNKLYCKNPFLSLLRENFKLKRV